MKIQFYSKRTFHIQVKLNYNFPEINFVFVVSDDSTVNAHKLNHVAVTQLTIDYRRSMILLEQQILAQLLTLAFSCLKKKLNQNSRQNRFHQTTHKRERIPPPSPSSECVGVYGVWAVQYRALADASGGRTGWRHRRPFPFHFQKNLPRLDYGFTSSKNVVVVLIKRNQLPKYLRKFIQRPF